MENNLNLAISLLSTTHTRWESLVQTLPAGLLTRRPAAGEWSALECLQHLLDSEEVFAARLEFFHLGQDFPAFDPQTQGTRLSSSASPIGMAASFSHLRQECLASLSTLTPEDFQRRARHSELGVVSLGEMVQEWAAHDLDHTMQAEKAMMQPFIHSCGPWQVYYQSHQVKEEIGRRRARKNAESDSY